MVSFMKRKDGVRKRRTFRIWVVCFLAGLLLGIIRIPVRAANDSFGQRVYDQADLFSEEEEARLEEKIQMLQEKTGMDAVLVTVKDAQGKSSEEYADDFYDENGFGTGEEGSGLLYLMDMDNRELYISTCGEMVWILTDERVEAMLEAGIARMGRGDYVGCAQKLFSDTERWYDKGVAGGQYQVDRDTGEIRHYPGKTHRSIRWYEALLAVAVSAFCGWSVCAKVRREYAMEQERGRAFGYYMAYRANAGFRFRNRQDTLTSSHIARQVIPRTSHRSSGGYSSSGRSTTHRSSSGRSHGGGGRKF